MAAVLFRKVEERLNSTLIVGVMLALEDHFLR